MRHATHRPWLGMILGLLLAGGCATVPVQPNFVEEVLVADENQVRTAVLTVLTQDGYSFTEEDGEKEEEEEGGEEGEETGEVVRTGYREEMNTWNWLLVKVFGVGRSTVRVTLSPEGGGSTRMAIEVTHEGRYDDYSPPFNSWEPYDPPVAQSADNIVRLVKKTLGIL